MRTQAQAVHEIFNGNTTEYEQGYEINQFCEGLQPVDVNQDWTNETTTYTFADGSAIRVSGPTYEVVS